MRLRPRRRRLSASRIVMRCCCFRSPSIVAGGAWLLSGDPIRGLAVLVAATPCPLILAAPVAFIAGVAQAARLGILIKGGKPFEALARTHTVMFDKTGTLTVGGARLVAIETAPGESPDDVLRMAGSLEQASHHVVASAVVQAALGKGSRSAGSVRGARDDGIWAGGGRSTAAWSESDRINWSMGCASPRSGLSGLSDVRPGAPL